MPKVAFLTQLTELLSNTNGPWTTFGDFNDLISSEEKRGGREFEASTSTGL